MNNLHRVVVEAPDSRGLRAVRVGGEYVGGAWSLRHLRRMLRRASLPPDFDLDDADHVYWAADKSSWPDRPWRRWAAALVTSLGLLGSATVLLSVGKNDTFHGLTYGAHFVGVVFIAAALVEAVAVAAAFDFWGKRTFSYSGAALIIGVGVVALTDLLFLLLQIQSKNWSPRLLLWVALAVWCVWALWAVTQHGVWRGVPHPKSVAMSFVASAAIGAAGIAYSQLFYLPYSTPMKFALNASFGEPTISADGSHIQVPTHFEFRNSGAVKIQILGTLWRVHGYASKFDAKGSGMNEGGSDLLSEGEVAEHLNFGQANLLGTGFIYGEAGLINPGVGFANDGLVNVPLKTGLNVIRLHASMVLIRGDRYWIEPAESPSEVSWDRSTQRHVRDVPKRFAYANPKAEFIRTSYKIHPSSAVLDITRKPAYASDWWILPPWRPGASVGKDDTIPFLSVAFSHDRYGRERVSEPEARAYDDQDMEQWVVKSVDQLIKEARK
ncbi:hypothetical protein [Streptomyces colonosanans]|uniref:hypothetical protein n=1 Tax=Streptomyces colonosanans TaxID=1428652 RepID=UPI00115FA687|nr:hypothetical protein [Streptomyces colonosanans]